MWNSKPFILSGTETAASGRMLIPLMLWQGGVLSQPYFYVSSYLEQRKDEYIERMRRVSSEGDWLGRVEFMLTAFREEAIRNLGKAESVRELYDVMKDRFCELLQSQWSTVAADFVFTRPDEKIIRIIEPASGRRAALYVVLFYLIAPLASLEAKSVILPLPPSGFVA